MSLFISSPYQDPSINFIYNILFCDSLELYKTNTQPPYTYPFDILFAEPHPQKSYARITFLVSDGLYFGEAPVSALFNDALAAPALTTAAQLVQFLTQKATEQNGNS